MKLFDYCLPCILLLLAGCSRSFHDKVGWQADDYFDDPQVIALCEAIEDDDLAEIDRLVAAGANVNARGKDNMTPLLWAYPDNKLARFRRLLEHGADPNVAIESDLGTKSWMRAGLSVTHMVCKSEFPGYFEAVFKYAGDPNLVNEGKGFFHDTPIFVVLMFGSGNRYSKVKTLVEKGADLNFINGGDSTPMMLAATVGQFDIVKYLLEAGADPAIYRSISNQQLIHILERAQRNRLSTTWTPQQREQFDIVVEMLEDRGFSLDKAREDQQRWTSWYQGGDIQEAGRKMKREVAERIAREKLQQGAANKVLAAPPIDAVDSNP